MNINSKDANQVWDYKGWFWDDVNKEHTAGTNLNY
jgi:hypothetical protein